jgi:hypothetical protein
MVMGTEEPPLARYRKRGAKCRPQGSLSSTPSSEKSTVVTPKLVYRTNGNSDKGAKVFVAWSKPEFSAEYYNEKTKLPGVPEPVKK